MSFYGHFYPSADEEKFILKIKFYSDEEISLRSILQIMIGIKYYKNEWGKLSFRTK